MKKGKPGLLAKAPVIPQGRSKTGAKLKFTITSTNADRAPGISVLEKEGHICWPRIHVGVCFLIEEVLKANFTMKMHMW